uniref:Reverse transcriptase Ty1/copia-type domain-containing protein n=1 Tax=Vitis vinifera TaxID=29760 RepID=A5BIK5_VITVI|nr:hypothetical protein VITISV_025091 [Vitis vinifera]
MQSWRKLECLKKNGTWDLAKVLEGKSHIGCKWNISVKHKPDGTIDRFKARLVAKGYAQTYGIDNQEMTLKVSVERKTFWVSFEGEVEGRWCSLIEHSQGSVFVLGFETEKVLDGGWDFTVSIAVAGKEYGMQVRKMGESTRHLVEAHTRTVGKKREEEDRSTVGKGSSVGVVGKTMEWRGGQKAENAPVKTRGTNRTTVGNNWPPTSTCRQGDRSRREPLTTERSLSGSDTLPLEDVFEARTQLVQGCYEEGTTPTKENAKQMNILKAPFLSKEKEKMRNIAIGGDGAGFKGFVGCFHSGSSVSDHLSYPTNRGKWLNFEGYCGMTEVEIFQNFIKFLENERGLVLDNSDNITEEILLYFKKLYLSPPGESWIVEGIDWSPISEESASRLDSSFAEEEIFNAIFQLDRDKASRPDGFAITVFQDC